MKNSIFVDCHGFDQGGQGTVSYIRNLYKPIIKTMPDINFYFGAVNIENLKKEFGQFPNVRYIKYTTQNKFLRLMFLIPFLEIKYKFTYVHFQYYLPIINFSKTIVTIHDVLFLDYPTFFNKFYIIKNKFLFRLSSLMANKLLTVSEYSKLRIIHYFRIKKNITVIPNAINSDIKINNNSFLSTPYILFVSRIEKRKNHIFLCEAFLKSKIRDKACLYIVGRKDEGAQEFFNYYESLPDKDKCRIKIFNNVSDKELNDLYSNAKLFVFPSLCEGFGIPPLEAVCYNISTICAYNTGMCDFEFFKDRFFDATDINTLISKIEKYYDNQIDMDKVKEEMLNVYSIKKISEKFSEFLNSLF